VATSGNRFAAHRKEGVDIALAPPICDPFAGEVHGISAYPALFSTQATTHPALIPHEAPGSCRWLPRIPATTARKALRTPAIPGCPRSARKRQDRPVTPEVAGSSPVAPVFLKYLHIKRLRCLAGRIGASRGAAFAARHACVPETARRKFLQVARPQAVSRGDSRELFAETRSCWPSWIKRPIPASERLGALHGIRRTPRGVRQPARAGLAHARHGSCVVCRTTRSRSGAQPPAASGCRGERSRSPARRVRRAPRIRLGRHGRTRRTVPRAGLRR
jgi:hypothetical protein